MESRTSLESIDESVQGQHSAMVEGFEFSRRHQERDRFLQHEIEDRGEAGFRADDVADLCEQAFQKTSHFPQRSPQRATTRSASSGILTCTISQRLAQVSQ